MISFSLWSNLIALQLAFASYSLFVHGFIMDLMYDLLAASSDWI
jgi:hypothetical protein